MSIDDGIIESWHVRYHDRKIISKSGKITMEKGILKETKVSLLLWDLWWGKEQICVYKREWISFS